MDLCGLSLSAETIFCTPAGGLKCVSKESSNEGNGHARSIDDSAANHIEHIPMVELGVHTPTAMRKGFQ